MSCDLMRGESLALASQGILSTCVLQRQLVLILEEDRGVTANDSRNVRKTYHW
jgi:hypothetical protein